MGDIVPVERLLMRPRVSFSEMNQFKECQHRWRLDYLEKRRGKVFGVHMDFGTALHGAIELWKSREAILTKETAVPHFRQEFEKLLTENRSRYKAKEQEALDAPPEEDGAPAHNSKDFFLRAGTNIIERFDECEELSTAQVVYNEFELDEPIERNDGLDVRFKGYIDMVIKTRAKNGDTVLYVCDFKTCGWGWTREKKTDAQTHQQVMLYKHFLAKKFDLDPKLVRTAFVLLKKRPAKKDPPVEFFPVSAGPVTVQRALDDLDSTITRMNRCVTSGRFDKAIGVSPDVLKNYVPGTPIGFCVNDFGDRCPHLGTSLCDAPIPVELPKD